MRRWLAVWRTYRGLRRQYPTVWASALWKAAQHLVDHKEDRHGG